MPEIQYRGRRAHSIENDQVRATVLVEGGHIAEILHKASGVNPLWTPPWPSIEPSTWSASAHPEYGNDAESKLLSGIMGHNLCLGLFGPPSPEEAAAGLTVHGDASIAEYAFEYRNGDLVQTACLDGGLRISRILRLDGPALRIREEVVNTSRFDQPVAWTEHVTLGPPFLVKGATKFHIPVAASRALDGQDFDWPYLPKPDGSREDLRVLTNEPASGGYTAHLMDTSRDIVWFLTWSRVAKLLFGYVWRRADFPWLGIWEENFSRTAPPWNGQTLTRGMEFGASPFPESRRNMIDRGSLFGVPSYRWLPAGVPVTVEYSAFVLPAPELPQEPPVSFR